MAVSYTHLDVYKRQLMGIEARRQRSAHQDNTNNFFTNEEGDSIYCSQCLLHVL